MTRVAEPTTQRASIAKAAMLWLGQKNEDEDATGSDAQVRNRLVQDLNVP